MNRKAEVKGKARPAAVHSVLIIQTQRAEIHRYIDTDTLENNNNSCDKLAEAQNRYSYTIDIDTCAAKDTGRYRYRQLKIQLQIQMYLAAATATNVSSILIWHTLLASLCLGRIF